MVCVRFPEDIVAEFQSVGDAANFVRVLGIAGGRTRIGLTIPEGSVASRRSSASAEVLSPASVISVVDGVGSDAVLDLLRSEADAAVTAGCCASF
jgi:hypothetical protein